MGKSRRQYTLQERIDALTYLDASGKSINAAARDLGIHDYTLRAWTKQRHAFFKQAEEAGLKAEVAGRLHPEKNRAEEKVGDMADVIVGAERQKLDIAAKIEKVVDQMLDHVLTKVEDANLDQLVAAIKGLIERAENMTYQPGREAREDRRTEAEVAALRAAGGERVDRALMEALRRRGALPPVAEDPGDARGANDPN